MSARLTPDGDFAAVSDEVLKAAADAAAARLGGTDKIRFLLGRFVPPGKTLRDIPADQRHDFLAELHKLARTVLGEADRFIHLLGKMSGVRDVQVLSIPKDGGSPRVAWEYPAENWITQQQAEDRNIYFSVNCPTPGYVTKAKKEHIEVARGLHVDLDPCDDASKPDCRDWTEEQDRLLKLAEVLKAHPMGPHIAVGSGNGLGLYWLTKPTSAFTQIESLNIALGHLLGGDKGTFNIDRIMRLPGTVNLPGRSKLELHPQRKPTPAVLLFAHEGKPLYTPEELAGVCDALATDLDLLSLVQPPQKRAEPSTEPPKEGKGDADPEVARLMRVVSASTVTTIDGLDPALRARLERVCAGGSDLSLTLAALSPAGPTWIEAAAKLRYAGFDRDETALVLLAHQADHWADPKRIPYDIARACVNCYQPADPEPIEDEDPLAEMAEDILLGQELSLEDLRKGDDEPVDYVVDRFVQAGTANEISGPGGVGKSLCSMQLAMAVAAGVPFWGYAVKPGMTVIYLSFEDDRRVLKRRLKAIEESMGVKVERLRIFDMTRTGEALIRVNRAGTTRTTGPDKRLVPWPVEMLPTGKALLKLIQTIPGDVLVVEDGRADTVEYEDVNGPNIDAQVRTGIRYINRYFCGPRVTMLRLAHPTVAGLKRGDASGGSVQHRAAMRGMCHTMEYAKDGPPTASSVRVLRTPKFNGGAPPEPINFHWVDGIWQPITDEQIGEQGNNLQAAVVKACLVYWDRGTPLQSRGALPEGFAALVQKLGGGKAAVKTIKEAASGAVADNALAYRTRADTSGNGKAGYCSVETAAAARAATNAKSGKA